MGNGSKKGILKDQIIRITGAKADDIPIELRLVVYQDPETGKRYEGGQIKNTQKLQQF